MREGTDYVFLTGDFSYIGALCERSTTGLWAEPLNALSSIGFFVAAYFIIKFNNSRDEVAGKWIWDVKILTYLVIMIGIGSVAFHTVSTRLTELMDIIPIVAFVILYFLAFLTRILHCNWFGVIISLLAFLGSTYFLVSLFPGALNDSIGYLSSMGALSVIAVYLYLTNRDSSRAFLLAALMGCISLFFRSVDLAACEVIPAGTHFIWHSLNAVLIYILMRQLILNVNRKARMLHMANLHYA